MSRPAYSGRSPASAERRQADGGRAGGRDTPCGGCRLHRHQPCSDRRPPIGLGCGSGPGDHRLRHRRHVDHLPPRRRMDRSQSRQHALLRAGRACPAGGRGRGEPVDRSQLAAVDRANVVANQRADFLPTSASTRPAFGTTARAAISPFGCGNSIASAHRRILPPPRRRSSFRRTWSA